MTICITNELKDVVGPNLSKVESPSLRLSKIVSLRQNGKKEEIEAVVRCHNHYVEKVEPFIPSKSVQIHMMLRGRLIINQAGGVLENAGLCLHRNLGYPYIPGSAIKGCARHYAWELWRSKEESEKKKELACKIAKTFGFPTGDKIPIDKKELRERTKPEEFLDGYLESHFP